MKSSLHFDRAEAAVIAAHVTYPVAVVISCMLKTLVTQFKAGRTNWRPLRFAGLIERISPVEAEKVQELMAVSCQQSSLSNILSGGNLPDPVEVLETKSELDI